MALARPLSRFFSFFLLGAGFAVSARARRAASGVIRLIREPHKPIACNVFLRSNHARRADMAEMARPNGNRRRWKPRHGGAWRRQYQKQRRRRRRGIIARKRSMRCQRETRPIEGGPKALAHRSAARRRPNNIAFAK